MPGTAPLPRGLQRGRGGALSHGRQSNISRGAQSVCPHLQACNPLPSFPSAVSTCLATARWTREGEDERGHCRDLGTAAFLAAPLRALCPESWGLRPGPSLPHPLEDTPLSLTAVVPLCLPGTPQPCPASRGLHLGKVVTPRHPGASGSYLGTTRLSASSNPMTPTWERFSAPSFPLPPPPQH